MTMCRSSFIFFINCLHSCLGCDSPITTIDLFIYSSIHLFHVECLFATLNNNWLNPIDKWTLLVFHLSLEKWAQRCTMERIDSNGSKKVETSTMLDCFGRWLIKQTKQKHRFRSKCRYPEMKRTNAINGRNKQAKLLCSRLLHAAHFSNSWGLFVFCFLLFFSSFNCYWAQSHEMYVIIPFSARNKSYSQSNCFRLPFWFLIIWSILSAFQTKIHNK